uniref:DB domain-containing protein n=1 Tax=Rhabditophanes sp. KR3021 TaxID=114890 RepID=A0AC35U5S3_9BILA
MFKRFIKKVAVTSRNHNPTYGGVAAVPEIHQHYYQDNGVDILVMEPIAESMSTPARNFNAIEEDIIIPMTELHIPQSRCLEACGRKRHHSVVHTPDEEIQHVSNLSVVTVSPAEKPYTQAHIGRILPLTPEEEDAIEMLNCLKLAAIIPLLLNVCESKKGGDMLENAAKSSGIGAVFSAIEPGVTIRQCNCKEQGECIQVIKKQVYSCSDKCFHTFRSITARPMDLKKCIDDKEGRINTFVKCFHEKSESCLPHDNGTMVPKHDIKKMFNIAEIQLGSHRNHLLKNSAIQPVRAIFNTSLEFAICVKNCVLEENKDGFCFDKINCQPWLTEKKTVSTIKKCVKQFDWKKEAGDLCECSLKAGVSSLQRICPMLKLMSMGSKKKGPMRGNHTTIAKANNNLSNQGGMTTNGPV